MTRVALRGLLGRKLRSVLTAISIVLGVAMVTGALVLGDTISKAFDSIFTSSYAQTDAVVSGKSLVDYSASGNATVDESLLRRIQGLPEVESAAGTILDIVGNSTAAKLLDRDGEPIGSSGNPNFGVGIDGSSDRFNPMRLAEGEWASGPDEVVIDREAATDAGFAVGDTIRVSAIGPAREFRISGLATYGDVDTLGGATFAVWDVPTAREMMALDGYTSISVAAAEGVDAEALVQRLETLVPASAQVRTGADQAAADKEGIAEFISFIRGFLLAFGGIALFVGAFVIFNTISITVAQRTRELATLRTLGASRRQVLRSVVLEALALGTIASAIGIGAGLALARGLSELFTALGLELPQSDPVYATRTFLVAAIVGVLVTVLAGLFPAIRATRIAPIAAVREGATLSSKRRVGPLLGLVLLVGGLAALTYAVTGGRLGSGGSLLALGAAALLLLVGVAAVASLTVTALARIVGIPARRLGGPAGRLASENAVRNPARTASTAAALMIGLALVAFVAVLGASVRTSLVTVVEDQFAADYVIGSEDGWSPVPTGAGDAVRSLPGVEEATSIRVDRGLVGESPVNVNAIDPATIGGMYRFDWREGSEETIAALGRDGAIVKQSFARDNDLAVGDRFTLTSSDGTPVELVVEGTYQPPRIGEVLGGVVLSQATFDETFGRPQDMFTLVRGSVGLGELEAALAPFAGAAARTDEGFVAKQVEFIGSFLNLLYVLLALSVVVSLFGMINTLVLSVFERTREIGMLRAIGLTRRQGRRMVRHESVITALIGAALGIPLGLGLAAAVVHGIGHVGVELALPVVSLLAFVAVAALAGIVAAVMPARRAGKLDVLAALQYE